MTTRACRGANEALQTYVKYTHKTALLCASWDKYDNNYRWAAKKLLCGCRASAVQCKCSASAVQVQCKCSAVQCKCSASAVQCKCSASAVQAPRHTVLPANAG